MNDFNFFSSAIESEKVSRRKRIVILLCFIVYIGIVSGIYYLTVRDIKSVEDEISSLKEYANSADVRTQLEEIRNKKTELKVFTDYYDSVGAIITDFNNANVITNDFIALINSTVPDSITFINTMYNPGVFVVNAISGNRVEIAEFYRNLKDLDIFSQIILGSISESEIVEDEIVIATEYSFDVQCILKGGAVR